MISDVGKLEKKKNIYIYIYKGRKKKDFGSGPINMNPSTRVVTSTAINTLFIFLLFLHEEEDNKKQTPILQLFYFFL